MGHLLLLRYVYNPNIGRLMRLRSSLTRFIHFVTVTWLHSEYTAVSLLECPFSDVLRCMSFSSTVKGPFRVIWGHLESFFLKQKFKNINFYCYHAVPIFLWLRAIGFMYTSELLVVYWQPARGYLAPRTTIYQHIITLFRFSLEKLKKTVFCYGFNLHMSSAVYIYIYIYMYVCLYLHGLGNGGYIYMCVYVYIYIYMCVCVIMNVYIYIYIYIFRVSWSVPDTLPFSIMNCVSLHPWITVN